MLLCLPAASTLAADPASAPPVVHQLLLDIARADARLVAVGERGRIFLSADQGRTWQPAVTPVEATLTAVYFHDDRYGWAVGHDAVILRTDDGGRHWSLVHEAPSAHQPLLDVWFQDLNRGFAVGAYGLFLETRDGGRQWQNRRLLSEDLHLNAIAGMPGGGPVYIAGEAGVLLRSDDGGRRWRRLSSPYRGSFFGVICLPDGNPLIFGMRGKAFRSPDGGRRWSRVDTQGDATLQGGAVHAGREVILVGKDGTVLVSRDSARSFARRPQEWPHAFASVMTTGAGLVLVGERGVTLSPSLEETGR